MPGTLTTEAGFELRVPKLPRDLSHREVVNILLREGWRLEREGRRHTMLTKGWREVSVPRHERIRTGTLRSILKQAGISSERMGEWR